MKAKKTTRKDQELLNTLWETTEAFYKAMFKQCSALEKALDASKAKQQKLEEQLALKAGKRKRVIGKQGVGRPKGSKNLRRVASEIMVDNRATGTND